MDGNGQVSPNATQLDHQWNNTNWLITDPSPMANKHDNMGPLSEVAAAGGGG